MAVCRILAAEGANADEVQDQVAAAEDIENMAVVAHNSLMMEQQSRHYLPLYFADPSHCLEHLAKCSAVPALIESAGSGVWEF